MKVSIAAAPLTHPMAEPFSTEPTRTGWNRALGAVIMLCALGCASPAWADELSELREQLGRGQAQAALTRLEGAVARKPELARDPQYTFLRGVALMDLERDAQALAVFEGMTQLYPELPDPWNNMAVLLVRAQRLEPARLALETALRNDPGFRAARVNLGLVHLMLAIQAWEAVAASGPVDAALLKRLEGARALVAR